MTDTPKKRRLEGRVALVTGASRGIGAAVAKAFSAEGAHVILAARTVGGLEAVDDAIQAAGGTATLLPLDLSKFEQIAELGPALANKFKRLDILVANAGILGGLSPVAMSDPKTWEQTFRINVLANYHLIRTLDPLLRGSDAGRAIFVTSRAAHAHKAFWGAYAASKAALEEMAAVYADEVAYSKLKVNVLDPGVVRTAMRAEAYPGEDPTTLPPPESIVESFIRLAAPSLAETGQIIRAA
ncbi:MAG: SDR family NAD(P)-dependent oxidoreductase [Alphaproteobacteria bacterium]|nr:SDR family NAD(P)-dependent oxidoreductase [Alphaproteobacteria bacterium]